MYYCLWLTTAPTCMSLSHTFSVPTVAAICNGCKPLYDDVSVNNSLLCSSRHSVSGSEPSTQDQWIGAKPSSCDVSCDTSGFCEVSNAASNPYKAMDNRLMKTELS